ncbi:exonuclease V subunit alpha [Gemmata sp. SH-PL17]|uniref:AAA domain-containing protein n=1 Tax=Gemmata sp. SH-PL17 TaxID=1630693 RepID=UPI00078C3575|nr:AAA domain-containing protein [Gemmata sp. SH-PL17]AMV24219.1 exonuclease V subunit alpha [Gemmata sp. SH-PL17]
MSTVPLPLVNVTQIGEYVRHHACERRFKLDVEAATLVNSLPYHTTVFNALDPVLREKGRESEDAWEESLKKKGLKDLTKYGSKPADSKPTPWADFLAAVKGVTPGQQAYGREIAIEVDFGPFRLVGRIDFVLVLWSGEVPRLRLVECKSSRRDRTYQRLQVAIYRRMARERLSANPAKAGKKPIDPNAIECVVARLDEDTNLRQDILALEPLDLWMKDVDIERLLSVDGDLARILGETLANLPYRIDSKCDDCRFNIHCLPESSRLRGLELLGLDPTTTEALRRAKIDCIDKLADLVLTSAEASVVRKDITFNESLEILKHKALARRATLPKGGADPDGYQVEVLPFRSQSQLPGHVIDGQRLIRIYLTVHYDYTENRIGGLSAHVTSSDWDFDTPTDWKGTPAKPENRPEVVEAREKGKDLDNHPVYQYRPLQGEDIVRLQTIAWAGDFNKDNDSEAALLTGFFNDLVAAIKKVAGKEHRAPLHFYVWSRGEVTQLVESFTRTGLSLHAFNQLLGCREGPEQLIFSCLHDEVERRYGLGWTSRGLVAAMALTWFGRRFHWLRKIDSAEIDLSMVFRQDVFDFKQTLHFDGAGNWTTEAKATGKHTFEIRSRFGDTLPAPYWRAYWGTLTFPPGADYRLIAQINRYHEGGRPGILEGFLIARAHGLRWLDERVTFKNLEIQKTPFVIANLPTFTLGINDVGQSSLDFLRLDHRVKLNDWIGEHLMPPAFRVLQGRTIPIKDICYPSSNVIRATINLDNCEIDLAGLRDRCDLKEGDFIRVSPCHRTGDLREGQTIRQLTTAVGHNGTIDEIDWVAGTVRIRVIPTPIGGGGGYYVLESRAVQSDTVPHEAATIDESVSDFVAGRVEARLTSREGAHVYDWFDPRAPKVPSQAPPNAKDIPAFTDVLARLRIKRPSGTEDPLNPEQQTVALAGLLSRVQLLQGPPGTGKTQTTSVALLLRILARMKAGVPKRPKVPAVAGDIILIAAHTHNAVDELLVRLCLVIEPFRKAVTEAGRHFPFTVFAKVFSAADQMEQLTIIEDEATGKKKALNIGLLPANSCAAKIKEYRKNGVLVIAGTTSALLKMADALDETAAFPDGLSVPMLVVDEASMLVFPHFLSLASLVRPDGDILLAGDHRQLAPIVAHDWDTEDRPTVETFKPHLSSYEALDGIKTNAKLPNTQIFRQALEHTFRLPAIIRQLIAPTYRRDGITLKGRPEAPEFPNYASEPEPWKRVWMRESGLFLVSHDERQSRRSNDVELSVVESIVRANPAAKKASIAIICPHRAQRGALQHRLEDLRGDGKPIKVIDTVEKLQGGEASTIIVSATASDPSAIGRNVEFILNLNRANVAFSRTLHRLVVVCADTLLNYMPVEVEQYEDTVLWKTLRTLCTREIGTQAVGGYTARIRTVPDAPAGS